MKVKRLVPDPADPTKTIEVWVDEPDPPAQAQAQPLVPAADPMLRREAAAVGLSPAERQLAEAQARAARAEAQVAVQAQAQTETQAQLANLTRMVEQEQAARFAAQLGAYRESVLHAYRGQIIPGMVGGNTVAAVDASAQASHQEYLRIVTETQNALTAQQAAQRNAPVAPPAAPAAAAPPQNPAYVPPISPPPAGSWPQVVNPPGQPQVPPPSPAQITQQFTSEQAVRSGVYARNRGALGEYLRSNGQQPFQAQAPQQFQPPQAQQPQAPAGYGAVQPQGFPTGPAGQYPGQQIPGYGAQAPQPQFQPPPVPQFQPPVQPQFQPPQGAAGADVGAAMDAVARAHAGQNRSLPGTAEHARAMQQFQAQPSGNLPLSVGQRFAAGQQ